MGLGLFCDVWLLVVVIWIFVFVVVGGMMVCGR